MGRTARAFLVAVAAIVAAGCGFPTTDITATNTERTGDYDIVHAVAGESLVADVCVANPARTDAIAERLVQQLASHGYRSMTLNFYSAQGPVGRVEWSGSAMRRASDVAQPASSGAGATTPCRATATGRTEGNHD